MKKLITIISLIAIVSLLASFLVVPASAEILTGSCGESVTYSFNEGTRELVISGTGPMADSVTEWNSFKTTVTKVTIQNGVTSIGKRAFSGFTILETIDIPASVQAIGNSAFADCLKLDGVIIPDGITTIERSTFSECYALSSIVIPRVRIQRVLQKEYLALPF